MIRVTYGRCSTIAPDARTWAEEYALDKEVQEALEGTENHFNYYACDKADILPLIQLCASARNTHETIIQSQTILDNYINYLAYYIERDILPNFKVQKLVKYSGMCPHCGSDDTCELGYKQDLTTLDISYECNDCGSTWTEHFTVIYNSYTYQNKEYDEDGDLLYEDVDE